MFIYVHNNFLISLIMRLQDLSEVVCEDLCEFNGEPDTFTKLCLVFEEPCTAPQLKMLLRSLPQATKLDTIDLMFGRCRNSRDPCCSFPDFSFDSVDWENQLSAKDTKQLVTALGSVTNLKSLVLGGVTLGDDGNASTLVTLAASLKAIGENLTYLHFPHLGSTEILALAPALKILAKLEFLQFGLRDDFYYSGGIMLSGQGLDLLLPNIDKTAGVRRLQLTSDDDVIIKADAEAAAALLTCLGSPAWLRKAAISCPFGETLAAYIKALPQLQELDLSGCNLGSAGSAAALVPALTTLTDLNSLSLKYIGLGEDGAKALAPALSSLAGGLVNLNLFRNNLGVDGAAALASALKKMTRLETLNLGDNRIGNDGFEVLLPALRNLGALQKLDLYCTDMGVKGAAALALALKEMTCLEELDLNGNHLLGYGGYDSLLPVWSDLGTLRRLDLHNTGLRIADADALASALRKMTHLEELDLGDNRDLGNNDGFEVLLPALKDLGALKRLCLCLCSSTGETKAKAELAGLESLTFRW